LCKNDAGIEKYSEYPMAAIVATAHEEKIDMHGIENFQAVRGKNKKGKILKKQTLL